MFEIPVIPSQTSSPTNVVLKSIHRSTQGTTKRAQQEGHSNRGMKSVFDCIARVCLELKLWLFFVLKSGFYCIIIIIIIIIIIDIYSV